MDNITIISGDSESREHLRNGSETLERCEKMPVVRQLYVKGLGYVSGSSNYSVKRANGINDFIVLFCDTGKGRVRLRDRSWDIDDGQFALLRPNVPHVFESRSNSPWMFFWIHFGGRSAVDYADMLRLDEDNPVLNISDTGEWIAKFEELYTSAAKAFSDQELVTNSGKLAQLLTVTGSLRTERNRKSRYNERRISRSIEYMTQSFMEPLALEGLAEKANLSVSQYSALFRKYTGTSPAKHLTQIRLRHACQQLKYSDRSVSEISHAVGFEDALYFSRLFKKNLGYAPSEYRKHTLP